MRVLVIGQGGREHAIVRGLKLAPSISEIHVAPGSFGMRRDAVCHQIDISKPSEVVKFALQKEFSLVIIGPEVPLAQGLADALRAENLMVFGPNKIAAQLEGSKVFAKNFMLKAGVPTARSFTVDSVDSTLKKAQAFAPPYVLKADGLAAGKGVSICQDVEALRAAAKEMFEERIFGDAGKQALLEEFAPGWELSYVILTNGSEFTALPCSQDHKKLLDEDRGPNTGGMGTVAPFHIDGELRKRIDEEIVAPCLRAISADKGMLYRGVLYIGLMITESGPKVIEFNVRFGDPEAQVIFPLLDGDWGQALLAVAQGKINKLSWKSIYSACVVLAAEGYPEYPRKNVPITGDVFAETSSSYFLHAGTDNDKSSLWITIGGRVMNAVGIGSTLAEAIENSYRQAKNISWTGMQMRKDIGKKALHEKK